VVDQNYDASLSRAEWENGGQHGWFEMTKLSDGRQTGLTSLRDGRTEYWNELTDDLPDPTAIVEQIEKFVGQLRAGSEAVND
jgi:hypothetical protein